MSEKVQMGDFLIRLMEDGTLRVTVTQNANTLVIQPTAGNQIDIYSQPRKKT